MERKNLKWVVTNKSKNRKGHLISGASCHTKLVWTNSNYKNYCSTKTASKRDYMQDTAIAPETTSLEYNHGWMKVPLKAVSLKVSTMDISVHIPTVLGGKFRLLKNIFSNCFVATSRVHCVGRATSTVNWVVIGSDQLPALHFFASSMPQQFRTPTKTCPISCKIHKYKFFWIWRDVCLLIFSSP